jgi:Zn finger protein HypA/HybF involved in hydrogenase expression
MSEQEHSHLSEAYQRMLERLRQGLERAEQRTREAAEHALQEARETAVELGELSREEAERISTYLRRDLADLGEHLEQTGAELRDWLHIDLELIEARVLDLLGAVADPTRVDLARLAERAAEYHSGEIAAPGRWRCLACGQELELRSTGHIPPCPKCHAGRYRRLRAGATD